VWQQWQQQWQRQWLLVWQQWWRQQQQQWQCYALAADTAVLLLVLLLVRKGPVADGVGWQRVDAALL